MNPLNHVAIIMDGNGRWGLRYKKSRNAGHKAGLKTVEKIIKVSIDQNIKFLTLYAFSTENWRRPKSEINFLFKLLEQYIDKELNKLIEQNIKIKVIGNLNKIPSNLKKKLKKVEVLTKKNLVLKYYIKSKCPRYDNKTARHRWNGKTGLLTVLINKVK